MALGYQALAMQRGLDLLGEASTLDGADVGKVAIERDVALAPGIMDRADDNFVATVDVATIGATHAPRVGQVLVHPDGTFKLDRKVEDNRHTVRFIVVETP